MIDLRNVLKRIQRMYQIPKDEDATRIIVRKINHRYYLHMHTMRFTDPYMEVEYNLARQRSKLYFLSNICVLMVVFSCVMHAINRMFNVVEASHDIYANPHQITTLYATILALTHAALFTVIRVQCLAYALDWCFVAIVLNLIWMYSFSFLLYKIVSTSLASNTLSNFYVSFVVLIQMFPLSICAMNIVFFHTLKILCMYHNLVLLGFVQTILIVLLNTTLTFSNWYGGEERETTESSGDGCERAASIMNGSDAWLYLNYQMVFSIAFWLIYLLITLVTSRWHEIGQRENFILKRIGNSNNRQDMNDTRVDVLETNSHNITDPSLIMTLDHNSANKALADSQINETDANILDIGEVVLNRFDWCTMTETNLDEEELKAKLHVSGVVPTSAEYTKSVKSNYDPFATPK